MPRHDSILMRASRSEPGDGVGIEVHRVGDLGQKSAGILELELIRQAQRTRQPRFTIAEAFSVPDAESPV